MFFNLFGGQKPEKQKKQQKNITKNAAAEGFLSLVTGIETYAAVKIPNNVAVALVLSVVDLSVRVLLNVATALGGLTPPFEEQYPLTRPSSRNSNPSSPRKMNESGRRSVHCRPIRFDSFSMRSDDESSVSGESNLNLNGIRSGSFSFNNLDEAKEEPSVNLGSEVTEPTSISLTPTSSLTTVPEHDLLKGFLRSPSTEAPSPQRRHHARHLSLEDDRYSPDLSFWKPESVSGNPPSPFIQAQEDLPDDQCTDTETVERVDSLGTIPESMSDDTETGGKKGMKGDKVNQEIMEVKVGHEIMKEKSIEFKSFAHEGGVEEKTEEAEYVESPCSSPRSVFSDSAATKFVNSNFCNPEFCEDPVEAAPAACCGGSIRQRYTMKRLQSLLSQRSRVTAQTPSLDGRSSLGRPPLTPQQDSLRSFRGRSFRGISSFRSRSGEEEEGHALSDAYRLVKLESCIRKAWKISMDDAKVAGGQTLRDSFREHEPENKHSPSLKSIKKMGSRRFDRAKRISFVKVPADFSTEMLMSRKQMLLNPAFGDEVDAQPDDDTISEISGTEETVMDAGSVVMRTPLRKLGETTQDYEKCEKNLDEGAYNNPLRLCSFRSYDSDTELELTSVRVRNPISRLLSFRVHTQKRDCIQLADIDNDEYGAMMFDQVNSNPIRDGMLEKYLTQLVIDDTLDAHLMGDVPTTYYDDDSLGWSTCQQEWVPQEMDDRLRCFLMDRFLIDNVLNEVDLNPAALKEEGLKGKSPEPTVAARKLYRS